MTDNSHVRVPNVTNRGREQQQYGTIQAIFVHQAWPDGPELCVLEVDWFVDHGRNPVSRNPLVARPVAPTPADDRL